MPKVNGKKFPYTAKGKKAAKKAKKEVFNGFNKFESKAKVSKKMKNKMGFK